MSGSPDGISCAELVELVTDFLDGALEAETKRRFIDHLAECDGCERYLDQFRQTIATAAELAEPSVPDEVRTSLLRAFRDWPD